MESRPDASSTVHAVFLVRWQRCVKRRSWAAERVRYETAPGLERDPECGSAGR